MVEVFGEGEVIGGAAVAGRCEGEGGEDIQEADAEADDEDNFVALEVAHEQTGADTEDGERDALARREVRDVDQRPERGVSDLLRDRETYGLTNLS